MTSYLASQGQQLLCAIDTASPVAVGYEVESFNVTKSQEILDTSGLRGTRSHHSERTRLGNITVAGTIELFPAYEDLATLMPLILGANASGTTYALAETLQAFNVAADLVAKVLTFSGCYINKATFSGSEGTNIKVSLDIIGTSEAVGNAGSFPGGVTFNNKPPLLFADSVLTLASTARLVTEWSVTIDNHLTPRFANSTTATSISPTDRTVSFSCTNPWTPNETDLYNQALAGAAATLVLATGGYSLTFAFATLQFPALSPVVQGRSEIPLKLEGIARMASTTKELIVTLDSTP